MSANEKQIGGSHYNRRKIQVWDLPAKYKQLNFYVMSALSYIDRAHIKHEKPAYNGWRGRVAELILGEKLPSQMQDLEKAIHFLEKAVEEGCHEYETLPEPILDKYLEERGDLPNSIAEASNYILEGNIEHAICCIQIRMFSLQLN